MSMPSSSTAFERPVRLLLGQAVGVIWTVEQALDWIDHQRSATMKERLKLARLALAHANKSRAARDVAAARTLLETTLARAEMLDGQTRLH
ncbi:MAG TPA: hypothetical protein VJR58_08270 [Vineibacter sp.]|nr:hypothetical protein [Vineibacter sp.]